MIQSQDLERFFSLVPVLCSHLRFLSLGFSAMPTKWAKHSELSSMSGKKLTFFGGKFSAMTLTGKCGKSLERMVRNRIRNTTMISVVEHRSILIRIWILPQVLQMLENLKIWTFIHSSASLHCFNFLASVIMTGIFSISDIILELFEKKFSFLRIWLKRIQIQIQIQIGRPWMPIPIPVRQSRLRIHNMDCNG